MVSTPLAQFDHSDDKMSVPQRLALISRHVVLFSSRVPVFAVVLVEDERIADVVEVPDSETVAALLAQYRDWNPVNLEHLCVSPGLIDLNVSTNGEWDGARHTTMAAVSGGVTLCAESDNLYGLLESQEEVYCDVGRVLLVQPSNIETLTQEGVGDCIALKAYMHSPTYAVAGVRDCLDQVLTLAETSKLSLMIDPSRPDSRMLFMASPCRHLSLDDREAESCFQDGGSFASAFAEEIDPASLSDSGSECRSPLFVQSAFCSPKPLQSPTFPLAPCQPDSSTKTPVLPLTRDQLEFPDVPGRKSPPKYKTLLEDLETRIAAYMSSIKELNRLELLAYASAGATVYAGRTRRASVEIQPEAPSASRRPSLKLIMHKSLQGTKDRKYIFFLANHPDHWESNGVEMVLRALRNRLGRCRVHFCNLSSALSVSKLLSSQKGCITCETCAHYLYFSASDIADGDTRMKTLPPIRSHANRALLWDLLKTNQIDLVTSHHSPIVPKQKYPETGKWKKALNGLASIGYTLQSLWSVLKMECESPRHYLVRLAKWCSLRPAEVLGVEADRGSISKGKYADLVVWDPEVCVKVTPSCKYPQLSPYRGMEFYGKVTLVFVRGKTAFDRGTFAAVGKRWSRQRK